MSDKITVIPSVRQVYSDVYGSLPTAGLTAGDFGYATDRLVLYRWDGTAWQSISIHSSAAAFGDIPTAADLPDGSLFYATDRGVVYQIKAAAWQSITIFSGSGTTAATPTAADLPDGSIYYDTDTAILYQNQSGVWVALVALFAANDPEDLTPASTAAAGTSADAAHRDHVHGMSSFVNMATGEYTGDNSNNRQITTGFRCDLVIILGTYWVATNEKMMVFIAASNSRALTNGSTTYDPIISATSADCSLHASNGFIIGGDDADYNANRTGQTYRYMAFGVT